MSKAIETLGGAIKRAMAGRPKVGGFPYLAETLRRAGVTRNLWSLPSGQSLYLTKEGAVVNQGVPLVSGMADVPAFDREEHVSGVFDGDVARGGGAVRRGFRGADGGVLRMQWGGVRRRVSGGQHRVV